MQTLLLRKSIRAFAPVGINLDVLSQFLTLSCGLRDDVNDTTYRTYPSAGGRFPIEVYAIIMHSDDLENGVYHFNVSDNCLELIKAGNYTDKIKDFYSNQSGYIETDYPCLLLLSVVFKRTMEKYGERGYRYAMIDAGHIGQNLYLVATYLKLRIVALGSGNYSDDKLDDIIGLMHSDENVFYCFALGHPN